MTLEIILALVVAACLIGYLIGRWLRYSEVRWHRRDAVDRSRQVILGQVSEKVAPIMERFPYDAKDMTFIGKWCDYIVMKGIDSGYIDEIVFLEIKTWSSQQNVREKSIEKAVKEGRVRYEMMRL